MPWFAGATNKLGDALILWLTCTMRVVASGNLTVELIRAQRFDVACQSQAIDANHQYRPCNEHATHASQPHIDRVELSPQAMASDPWSIDTQNIKAAHQLADETVPSTPPGELPIEPERLSPVVGSPALSGLGAAWVVPGTLLDVVA
ncbi:MAG: hypothetical protein AB8C95_10275 [Phycisphaeraceae bacterium]